MIKASLALSMNGDSPAMVEAVEAILKLTKRVTRKTKYQLKIGVINFYPDNGTIHLDQGPRLLQGGLDLLIKILGNPHSRLGDIVETCKSMEGVLPPSWSADVIHLFGETLHP